MQAIDLPLHAGQCQHSTQMSHAFWFSLDQVKRVTPEPWRGEKYPGPIHEQ